MSHQVIARKWRPKNFKELIGQEHVGVTLVNALRSGRGPQALLFTGPRGTGKTSSARIYAKALRCTNLTDFAPCGVCSDCEDIATSRHLDVMEIDGASNNGVDAIRELRETVGYMPSSGKIKVYIIDEVHMLSTSAFNALLKTVEEPPAHVVFIMATTEAHKIPNTILSRCQRFDFRTIANKEITNLLEKICKQENVSFDNDALWLIARQGAGSMRDALTLLEQVITYGESKITNEIVRNIVGLTDRQLINQALTSIVNHDNSSLAQVVSDLFTAGADTKLFLKDLLEQIRNALFVKIEAHKNNFQMDLPDTEISFLENLSSDLSQEDIHMLFDIAFKGSQGVIQSIEPRLALEMLLFKMAAAPRVQSLLAIASGSKLTNSRSATTTTNEKKNANKPIIKTKTSVTPNSPQVKNKFSDHQAKTTATKTVGSSWQDFVNSVKNSDGFLGALLENTFLIERNKKDLTLGLSEKMGFLLDKLDNPEAKLKVKNFVKTLWNEDLNISITKSKSGAQKLSPRDQVKQAQENKEREVRQAVERHPLVKKTQELFNTEISSIKEMQ